jgi:hypothetical protein
VEFQRETLEILMRHYGRAPLNRVYAFCNRVLLARFPSGWSESNPLVVVASVLSAIARYLRLNRGIHKEDLRMIRMRNLRKMFRSGTASPGESRQ